MAPYDEILKLADWFYEEANLTMSDAAKIAQKIKNDGVNFISKNFPDLTDYTFVVVPRKRNDFIYIWVTHIDSGLLSGLMYDVGLDDISDQVHQYLANRWSSEVPLVFE